MQPRAYRHTAGSASAPLYCERAQKIDGALHGMGVEPSTPWNRLRPVVRHRPAKAEIRRRHRDPVSQLAGAKADQVLGQRSPGTQQLGGAPRPCDGC